MVRIGHLSTDSGWSHAIWPVDPDTGERSRAQVVAELDDADAVDAFFARQAR